MAATVGRDEDRYLDQNGQAAHQRVEAVFGLQLAHFGRLALQIAGISVAKRADLGLQALHATGGSDIEHRAPPTARAQHAASCGDDAVV